MRHAPENKVQTLDSLLTGEENGGGKGRCVGERERGKRRREKERGGRVPD
jgi:hypothetical protein